MKVITKRLLYIIGGILIAVCVGYLIWQNYKYKFVKDTVADTVAQQTDSLYSIKYDSLSFDEVTGYASIKNIHVIPDTNRAKKLNIDNMPNILLNITIASLTVTGVKTAKALQGKKIEGDSVIIDHPEITMYSMKALQKGTKIELQANKVYEEILGNLDLIKVGFVFVNNVTVKGVDFYSKEKNFDFINGKFVLEDVFIDSAHNLDTNRVLFCRQAAFTVDSFFSYNHNRREITVKDVHFLGKQKQLSFSEISADRFSDDSSKGVRLLDAKQLKLTGVNTNEVVKNKNIMVDTIVCPEITFYELPVENLKISAPKEIKNNDSTGFSNVYGVYLKNLNFPKVSFIPFAKSNYKVGNIAIKLNEVKANVFSKLIKHPMNFTKEAEVDVSSLSLKSKDESYNFTFNNISLNSLNKELKINSFNIVPFTGEKQFANKFHFQSDRFDVSMTGISLKDINMNDLLDERLAASELVIDQVNAKISRDLHKPLQQKSKVGNYLSQLLMKLDKPVMISKARINNALIAYRENQEKSDSVGVVTFYNSRFNISNITNIPSEIKKNNQLKINFDTKVLQSIPLKGSFNFVLNDNAGHFTVNGHVEGFDAEVLNKVSIPMALIHINGGQINSLDFNFKGNNTKANGVMTMKYKDLKVDVLKRDKNTKEIKKRGLASLGANLLVKNDNPGSEGLREVNPEYDRNIYKSFFNLVWKTLFTGMKQTVGIP
jgi:hypothetical protein